MAVRAVVAVLCAVLVEVTAVSERDVLVSQASVVVPFGRSVFLDPARDLKLGVRPGDRCRVRVVQTDALSQRPGRLLPSSFPCDFSPHTVQYRHLGGRSPAEDSVPLQIRYDSPTETLIIPVSLFVDVSFVQLELVTRNIPLVVKELGGLSRPIDNRILQFSYDRDTEKCQLSVLPGTGGWPRYGEFMDGGRGVSSIDCDEFLEAGFRYHHQAGRTSPNRDYIPMVAQLFDQDGEVMKKQEHFHVMVKIREGARNAKPELKDDSLLLMEVDQFVMTAITPDVLSAVDRETPDELLVFNITQPLNYGEGFIVSTNDRNQPVRSFTQRDLQDLKIAYVPPSIDADVERVFTLNVTAVDFEGETSDPIQLVIIVKPMNTLAPVVTRNTGIQLFEGQSRPLSSSQNLEVSDEDNLEDVRLSVLAGLRHGNLNIMGLTARYFTPADLDAGVVRYQHDGSNTYSDNIIFRMTDGENDVEFLFPITVHPEDDDPPILNVNMGLTATKRDVVKITPFILSATDVDSDDNSIVYTFVEPVPYWGRIIKRQKEMPEDTTRWTRGDGYYEKTVEQWTQKDIVEGKIFYAHNGEHVSEATFDRLLFQLKDDNDPPNESRPYQFLVKVLPVDDRAPYLSPGTELQQSVDEYKLTPLRRHHLRYVDGDSEDRDLKFSITSAPVDSDPNWASGGGKLVLCEDPDVELSSFTQAQVNHHKICYKPPDKDLGVSARAVSFRFKVEDPSENALEGQEFKLFLKPVNNKPPIVTNQGLTVFENGFVVLSPQNLDATDPDSNDNQLRFVVTELPKFGKLRFDGDVVEVGDSFGRDDIITGKVSYRNMGEEMEMDSVRFQITDGLHTVPIAFKITVKPVDDEAPSLEISPGRLGAAIVVGEGQSVSLTDEHFSASDPDTEDLMLTFIIDNPPARGIILKAGERVRMFKQKDLQAGLVEYQHVGGELGLEEQTDVFNLTISDMSNEWIVGGNKITGITATVTILPEDNIAPRVVMGNPANVSEGGKTALLLTNVDVLDEDTSRSNIMCTVLEQPSHGYLENNSPAPGSEVSRIGIPISAFSLNDLEQNIVNYVQSIHKGIEPMEDRFTFQCSDGVNLSSPRVLQILINPTNDEIPQIFVREFIVKEGDALIIDMPILNAVDEDVPQEELTFSVARHPKNGRVIRQEVGRAQQISHFSAEDIKRSSSIMYQHDNSETTKDSLLLKLSDGLHEVEKEVIIMVIPVDDETPRLTINNGLDIEVGEVKTITNDELMATDLDSSDPAVVFVVRKAPSYGFLQKRVGTNIFNLTRGMDFTQEDIDSQYIQYHHTGREGVRDLIKFDVTDGTNPLIDRYFYVSIDGVDTEYPEVLNKGLELPQGGSMVLTTDLLSTTDSDSADKNLEFTVSRTPSKGHLEFTNNPGVPITKFTQLQLAANKVRYVHTNDDEMKMDSFEFEVTDGYNPVYRTFRISLNDIDNKKPILMIEKLRVKEGGIKLITPFELKADDEDTKARKIRFTIHRQPEHGQIRFNQTRDVSTFTMADLNNNMITFHHDGSESLEDSFEVVVTDGTHSDFYVFPETSRTTRQPQTVRVQVTPVDNSFPHMGVNTGSTYLQQLEFGGIGLCLTDRMLLAEDRDTEADKLVYSVTLPPRHGYLINQAHGNRSITAWTQGDVDRGQICFLLKHSSYGTQDAFSFTVTDKGENKLLEQTFHLRWSWVSFVNTTYSVKEAAKKLHVTLRRRGFLGETSFVTITVVNGTAVSGQDFRTRYAQQVQFSPGEAEKTWRLRLVDDDEYEGKQELKLLLGNPDMALVETPQQATVIITDEEDESIVSISESTYSIREGIGEFLVPLRRHGDVTEELMVICSTEPGTAVGTVARTVTSYSDYISRPEEHESFIRFDRGETEKFCPITVIDDTLFEEEETFSVVLSMCLGGKLGEVNRTKVTIQRDTTDESQFRFEESAYEVEENGRAVDVTVIREGTDVGRPAVVTVRSKRTNPSSAEAGLDYVAVNRALVFAARQTRQQLSVRILDDRGMPMLEGPESFELVLRMPMNGTLGDPNRTTITINDTLTDLPTMQFKESQYSGREDEGQVSAVITRTGDLGHMSSVRCYTRQASARAGEDFWERPNTDLSTVTFQPGEREQLCTVDLKGDGLHEGEETFRLVLGSPESPSAGAARIGARHQTTVKLQDLGDKSIIKFGETKYTVKEPRLPTEEVTVTIPVLRLGDTSQSSLVRVYTKDGSADSGSDYVGFSKELKFEKNITEIDVVIDVLYDEERETREVFTVHMRHDRNKHATIQMNKAIVYIEEREPLADVTFPVRPLVASLRDYDDVENREEEPMSGYPIICITPCDPQHPQYDKTGPICEKEGINNTLTLYRWRVAVPTKGGMRSQMSDVESDTFFTDVHRITLDSIYFGPGWRVQCVARAVDVDGNPGLELGSSVVTVSPDASMCPPRVNNAVGAEPFSAKMKYTGADDPDHPNMVELRVRLPHRDGMLPAISTHVLSNFELALSRDAFRLGLHQCSNLVDVDEARTAASFLTNETRNINTFQEVEPHQYSEELRGNKTLRFYKNLDLESCMWEFTGYFSLSELVSQCGGRITTDAQVRNLLQSFVSVKIPLFVSYLFYAPDSPSRWQHSDLHSQLRLNFVYNTAILWEKGITTTDGSELQGKLYPTSVRIQPDGRLAVNFRTEANFRGQFVPNYPGTGLESEVFSPHHPELTYTLEQERSEPTFSQPQQTWTFTSDMAVKDYSGDYKVRLIPCTTPPNQRYSEPVKCNPRDPLTFDLAIRFQQVSDPVPAEYSLNTQFHLLRKRALWLSDGSMGFGEEEDSAFTPDDQIYGRIMVDPLQSLGQPFHLNVEKVFLCTGKDGYIPKYDPQNQEYGCVGASPRLLYTFRLLDYGAPETCDKSLMDLPFNARLAIDDPDAAALTSQTGSDGFSLEAKPLFQVDSGRQWFVHAIYSVRSEENSNRGIGKRSVAWQPGHVITTYNMQPDQSTWDKQHGKHTKLSESLRMKRAVAEVDNVGLDSGKGTNMIPIILDFSRVPGHTGPGDGIQEVGANAAQSQFPLVPVMAALCILIVLVIIVIIIVIFKRRQKSSLSLMHTATIINPNGPARVIQAAPAGQGQQSHV